MNSFLTLNVEAMFFKIDEYKLTASYMLVLQEDIEKVFKLLLTTLQEVVVKILEVFLLGEVGQVHICLSLLLQVRLEVSH